MDRDSVLGALRRYWWAALALAVLGLILGALPQPATKADSQVSTFFAAHTLLVGTDTGSIYNDPVALNQLVLFTITGEVPSRAAEKLDESNPAALAAQVQVTLDQASGALAISTTQATADKAVKVADAFAEELTAYIAESQDARRTVRLDSTLSRLEKLEKEIAGLQRQAAAKPDDRVLQAQLDAKSRQYSVVFEQYDNLQSDTATLILTTLQRAQAIAQTQSSGLSAPKSRTTRGALGLIVGSILGVGVAVLMGRLDRRVRSRAQAEGLFGGPTSVVIPTVSGKHNELVVTSERHDRLSDAFRTLRSVVVFSQSNPLQRATAAESTSSADQPVAPKPARAKITLVVSAGSGDGKTTVASNLAAAFAESGKRTIAVNTDFRRPSLTDRIMQTKPTPHEFSLEEVVSIPVRTLLSRTGVPDLALLDLSTIKAAPGDLARATCRLLPFLTELSDAVVIDSSPLGATAEVLELLPFADTIVMVMRIDHTMTAVVHRTMEVLRGLTDATLILTLVGEVSDLSPYYEYTNKRDRAGIVKRLRNR